MAYSMKVNTKPRTWHSLTQCACANFDILTFWHPERKSVSNLLLRFWYLTSYTYVIYIHSYEGVTQNILQCQQSRYAVFTDINVLVGLLIVFNENVSVNKYTLQFPALFRASLRMRTTFDSGAGSTHVDCISLYEPIYFQILKNDPETHFLQ